jgi:hypothetical protein
MALYSKQPLSIYNSLSGKKEIFRPISEGNVGMYVCGPLYIATYIWVTAELLSLLI